jgi:hypothetical protein
VNVFGSRFGSKSRPEYRFFPTILACSLFILIIRLPFHHLHTVEVVGSNPAAPTNPINDLASVARFPHRDRSRSLYRISTEGHLASSGHLRIPRQLSAIRTNLPPLPSGRTTEVGQEIAASNSCVQHAKTQKPAMDHSSGVQEKPAWHIHREEVMARLDREAELNRQREERWATRKVFKMRPFVGRQEPD